MGRGMFMTLLCSALAVVPATPGAFGFAQGAGQEQDPTPSSSLLESLQAAGDLDPTFGNKGIKTTDFFGNYDAATSLALQADGKIVLAGIAYHGSTVNTSDFALARYNTDGSLDTGFGVGGKQSLDFVGSYDQANGVAIQSDSKIVAVGASGHSIPTSDFALARYNPDGTLDQGFGSSGMQTTDFFGNEDSAFGVVIQPDGKIVLAGYAHHGVDVTTSDFAMARYNSDGSLDQTFGSSGKVTTDFFGSDDVAYRIALQPDGKLVLAGLTFNPATKSDDFAVARYNPNGSLDSSFGAGGKQTTDFFGGLDYAAGVAIQQDGKVVLAGLAAHGSDVSTYDFALLRYNQDGSLDQAFGAGGRQTTDFFGNADYATGVAIQADGKIVVAGYASHGSSTGDLALARYNLDGALDQSFGAGGLQTTNLLGNSDDNDTARAVGIQQDGGIVVAGNTQRGLTQVADFAVARYYAAPALPDFTIGFNSSTVSAQAGSKVALTVLVNRIGGFGGNVTITPPAASMGIKPKPPDPITTSSSSAVLKMKIGAGVAPGSYSRTFTATDDSGRTRTATVTIVVQ